MADPFSTANEREWTLIKDQSNMKTHQTSGTIRVNLRSFAVKKRGFIRG
jgi:hypothetical protein